MDQVEYDVRPEKRARLEEYRPDPEEDQAGPSGRQEIDFFPRSTQALPPVASPVHVDPALLWRATIGRCHEACRVCHRLASRHMHPLSRFVESSCLLPASCRQLVSLYGQLAFLETHTLYP
eukprot:jgi/Mesen1/4862/ME000244S04041